MLESGRRFNMVVFGATGFTGKHVVEQIVQTFIAGHSEHFTWAVAGRSVKKLEEILLEVSTFTGVGLKHVEKIVADVSDQTSLEDMAAQCDIILNTVGPYAKYGEAVIKACIKSRTHHLDVSAETLNLTEMQLGYHKEAENAGVYVIGSCGFDSIPNEVGINTLREKFKGNLETPICDLNSVESYLYVGSHVWSTRINYGTWTSILHFYSKLGKLRPLLTELYPKELPISKYKVNRRYMLHRNNTGESGWCMPFPHPDLWAVEKTQNNFYANEGRRPFQFVPYLKQSNIFITLLVIFGCLLYGLIMKIPGGLYLLDHFPRLFSIGIISKEGPTRAQMEAFAFSFTLIGNGWDTQLENREDGILQEYPNPPNKRVVLKMSGTNPAYGFTCMSLIQSGLTVLNEKKSLPSSGGVFTPGVAFAKTSLAQRLDKHGFKFEFLE